MASGRDVEAIAALHADSWRRNYRGAYLNSFLDGDVLADRRAVWTDRLSQPSTNHFTVVAERDGEMVGFAHTILDDDPDWGALLENLHVTHDLKRRGTGSHLMSETSRELLERRPRSGLSPRPACTCGFSSRTRPPKPSTTCEAVPPSNARSADLSQAGELRSD